MKKTISFLAACIITANLFAQQAGRIKISLVGAQCNRETWDDILQLDGKGDELFFHFDFVLSAQNGSPKLSYNKRTGIYGDRTNANWSNRSAAGSAVDLFGKNMGGIKGGDKFTCNELMGEYDMEGYDVLSIIPTIWEWDGGPDIVSSFASSLNSLTAPIAAKAVQIAGSISPALGDVSNCIISAGAMVLPTFTNIFSGIFGKAGDRPIGLATDGSFGPKTILIKTVYAQTLANSNFGYGPGVIAVNYNEEALGNSRDHGNYSLLIRVEFTPKPGSTPVATAQPGMSIIKTILVSNKVPAEKTPAPPAPPASPIAGDWTGTYGDGANNGPIFYSFRFGPGGVMSTLDRNGNVLNTGTYSFANSQVSGHYDQYSFAGTLDASGTFNGTWGSGNSTSGLGRWAMRKK